MEQPIYRVRVVLDKFYPEFEGQHPWNWSVKRLRTTSISETKHPRDAFENFNAVADALTLGRISPPSF